MFYDIFRNSSVIVENIKRKLYSGYKQIKIGNGLLLLPIATHTHTHELK